MKKIKRKLIFSVILHGAICLGVGMVFFVVNELLKFLFITLA